jgi:hypothetical protein
MATRFFAYPGLEERAKVAVRIDNVIKRFVDLLPGVRGRKREHSIMITRSRRL